MSLTQQQIDMLSAHLSRANVRTRQQAGQTLSYIESWWAISEANRIFGYDGWASEVIETRCVAERERTGGKDGWSVSYVARVRVTLFAGDRAVIRDGMGAGHGIDRDLGKAHESAIKECESDARKRALMTFGNPFGLALYDKEQRDVADAGRPPPAEPERPAVRQYDASTARLPNGAPVNPAPPPPQPRPNSTSQRAAAAAPPARGRGQPADTRVSGVSGRIRGEMLHTLAKCATASDLAEWEQSNNRDSGKWQRMTVRTDFESVKQAHALKRKLLINGADTQAPLN